MTVRMSQFGEYLVTRQDAKEVLQVIGVPGFVPTCFDFTGVEVVNHGFADQLWKGLASKLPSSALAKVKLTGTNEYVKNCLEAGFATAVSY
jgi:hypothetical protein